MFSSISCRFLPQTQIASFPFSLMTSRRPPPPPPHAACLVLLIFNSGTSKTLQIQYVRCLPKAHLPAVVSASLGATLLFDSVNIYRASTGHPEIRSRTRHSFPLFRIQPRGQTAHIIVGLRSLFRTHTLSFVILTALLRISGEWR